jgi:hypothetical protein
MRNKVSVYKYWFHVQLYLHMYILKNWYYIKNLSHPHDRGEPNFYRIVSLILGQHMCDLMLFMKGNYCLQKRYKEFSTSIVKALKSDEMLYLIKVKYLHTFMSVH